MIDRVLQFVALLLICSNIRLKVDAFQHFGKISNTGRYHVDTASIQPFMINQRFRPKFPSRLRFSHSNKSDNEQEIIYVDEASSQDNTIPDDVLEEMNAGQPSELVIMKDVSSTGQSFCCLYFV